ncbi:MAG TPA: macro domain-containing protein [Chthoniobacteraceae bacterium]|nr:macro domain-containing protein [Chthoniobacteraceae bacterium]
MSDLKLHLVDCDGRVVDALGAAFAPFPEVTVQCADILKVAEKCVVSPANSQGFLDGGIDALYRDFFGPALETKVRDSIGKRPDKLLPVGAALFVPTAHERIPWLCVAPTMETPEAVESRNCYRALWAVLRTATAARVTTDIYCPGLATGTGRVPAEDAAQMMARAYGDWRRSVRWGAETRKIAPTAENAGNAAPGV